MAMMMVRVCASVDSLCREVGAMVGFEGNLVPDALHVPLLPGLGVAGEDEGASIGRGDAEVRPWEVGRRVRGRGATRDRTKPSSREKGDSGGG